MSESTSNSNWIKRRKISKAHKLKILEELETVDFIFQDRTTVNLSILTPEDACEIAERAMDIYQRSEIPTNDQLRADVKWSIGQVGDIYLSHLYKLIRALTTGDRDIIKARIDGLWKKVLKHAR